MTVEQAGGAGGLGGRVRAEGLEKGKGMGGRDRLVLRWVCAGLRGAGYLICEMEFLEERSLAPPQFIIWGKRHGTIATWG